MFRILPVLLLLPLVLAYGVAEGLWTNRWQTNKTLEQAPRRLASLPQSIGSWEGEDVELDARQVRQAELRGYVRRRYVQAQTGETLTVLAVCGRAGPVAVHSPEVCFGGAGFTAAGPRTHYTLDLPGTATPAVFWAERYQKAGAAIPEQFQVYYGWNTGTGWQAADSPRLYFASAPALYKIYVVRNLAQLDDPTEKDPIPGFLHLLIPEMNRCLFDARETAKPD